MRILHVVGARPQFIKLAPVSRAIAAARCCGQNDLEELVVHTGQHYDDAMSGRFFLELELPPPAINLEVGPGSHGLQTGRMLARIERALIDLQPAVVLVYGDTNSTLAGALAAVKLGVPVAHVEAGLRSGNRQMPEEINRIATDHVCELLFAPTRAAVENLQLEGLGARAEWVGDVMADSVLHLADRARHRAGALDRLQLRGRRFGVATIHRAANTEPDALPRITATLDEASQHFDALIVPLHPGTRSALERHCPTWRPAERVILCEPLGYADMLQLLGEAEIALTDSGGLQKEAFLLGTPCVTLRNETEWIESVEAGGNFLAGIDPGVAVDALRVLAKSAPPRETLAQRAAACYGHGKAAQRIVAALCHSLSGRTEWLISKRIARGP